MKLSRFLKMTGIKQKAFALSIDRSGATVSRIVRGIVKPDWDTMSAIKRVTEGAVTPDDFLDDGRGPNNV